MLQVEHVTRRFGDLIAVDDVSFTVAPGRITGFVGANGAGKTTTMRMIMGVLAPTWGQIRWRGHPITAQDRRCLGYMPEERGLYPKQKVLDQLAYLARLRGMSRARARASAGEHLEMFGLGERAGDPVEKLSLGNQQRVQIIAALVASPAGLILDEPFSGLDPAAVDAMSAVLARHTACGVPVLFSSHQLELVERLCDELVVLSAGRVVLSGEAAALRARATRAHRLELDADAAWVRDVPGVRVLTQHGPHVTLELGPDETGQVAHRLLSEALRRGQVRQFAPVVPTLAQLYRQVTSA